MAALRLVDTHSHVMVSAFDGDRAAVLQRARDAGVAQQVCVGYSLKTSRAALRLASPSAGLYPTVGIHPNDAATATAADFDEIARLARTPGVVGIGETGLDYYRDRTPPARHSEALERQLVLAVSLAVPG
jgi:TatD DNase family protein